jgi:2-polyprenyl-3-methyl-5-hydroxy-6-metoxy-1,4-benzoquinol methylase
MANNPQPKYPVSQQPQTTTVVEQPFPARFFDSMTAFKRGAALKGAIELDLFTVLAEGSQTPESLALRLQASARGVRILCDYLTVEGFLTKQDRRYSVTPDVAMFLNRKSPTYIGSAAFFLNNRMLMENFHDLAGCVRNGGTVNGNGTLAPDNPVWVEFARSMQPIAAMDAELVARTLRADAMQECKVLDIAAGHGMYGIALARHNPNAEIVAVDWKNVLAVARENAEKAGVSGRHRTIEGSAFDVDFGDGYDVVLLTNFLHHFNAETNESLLRKVHRALKPGGRAVTVEFVPNEDRLTPAIPAEFSLVMLASTPDGDAYTFSELESMCRNAGFRSVELHEIPPSPQRVAIAIK